MMNILKYILKAYFFLSLTSFLGVTSKVEALLGDLQASDIKGPGIQFKLQNESPKKHIKKSKTVMEVFDKIMKIDPEDPGLDTSYDIDDTKNDQKTLFLKNLKRYPNEFRIFIFIFDQLRLSPVCYKDSKNKVVMFEHLDFLRQRLLNSPYNNKKWKYVKKEYKLTKALRLLNKNKPLSEWAMLFIRDFLVQNVFHNNFNQNPRISMVENLLINISRWEKNASYTVPINKLQVNQNSCEVFSLLSQIFGVNQEAKSIEDFIKIKDEVQKRAKEIIKKVKNKK